MFPENFPEDADSEAERHVFNALKECLGAEYTVIAQVAWLARGPCRPEDGEADLVVIHPDWGFLTIEVKGGVISSDPLHGWSSNGTKIKDPVKQARAAGHELWRRLRSANQTRAYTYTLGYGVWFPDVDAARLPQRPEAPDEIVLDGTSLNSAAAAIEGLFNYWYPEDQPPGPGPAGVDALVRLLAPSWILRPLLGSRIQREAAEQRRLTEQQFSILRGLRNRRRALIAGCAGSGKTVLAVEKARTLAEDGSAVLFTCFNRNLAKDVRARLDGTGVEVAHFHDLCYRLGREAGADLPDQEVAGMPDSYFAQQLPAALELAASRQGPRYDAIVVDEGQDFEDMWWVPLTDMLRDARRGILYIFFDDRQDLYKRARAWPIDDEPFELTVNCRSTQAIHRHLQKTLPGTLDEIECLGPPGRPVEQIQLEAGADESNELRKVLHRLINDEAVRTSNIVVLTPRNQTKSQWKDGFGLANIRLRWTVEPSDGEVQVCTIHSFKGLDRPVVILTELEHLYRGREQELLYVARSRAMNHLVELGSAHAIEKLTSED